MEYPIWQLTTLGGGFWIALIATVHVFIAQFAVGGGLFLVLTERYAYGVQDKAVSESILGFVKKHSRFFLLLSMVMGAVTGVGIWFSIALIQPQGTLILIHYFVFGWATEWVFFLAEIAAILIYYHYWDRLSRKNHLTIGWLYFLFAWASLFLVNGIIGYMLTPGAWIETRDFWDGFFNPTFWPQLVFRSFLSFTIAGLFGFLTATRIKDADARARLVRLCSVWTILPFLLMLLAGWWYLAALPEPQAALVMGKSHRVANAMHWFWIFGPAMVVGGLILAVRLPSRASFPLALLVLLVGFGLMGSFEVMREAGRKPYVIWDTLYSNSIEPGQVELLNAQGALATAKWVDPALKTPEGMAADPVAAGHALFQLECAACHSVGGPINDIKARTAKFSPIGMDSLINGMGKVNGYMPLFAGTRAERQILADYIVTQINGKTPDSGNAPFEPVDLPLDVPPLDIGAFDPAPPEEGGSGYVLLAWNNLGMHCISDSDQNWILLPPANDLFAQLIKRDYIPEVVTDNVAIHYEVESAFANPSSKVRFWEFAHILFGLPEPLPANVGLGGNGVSGDMRKEESTGVFEAKLIPVVPYPETGPVEYNPYPLFTISATDATTGELLAQTRVVAPTSTEMGCRNCHGGPWKVPGVAGISDETGQDVLTTHDRMSGTNLKARAEAGQPVLCQSCHPDPVLGSGGDMVNHPGLLNLPAALHGLHANYLTGREAEACTYCHPNRPDGPTACLRGLHGDVVTCTDCHGYMEDHAAGLLKAEQEQGKPRADALLAHLKMRTVDSLDVVNPRVPWLNQPDCLNCHQDFEAPSTTDAYNVWTSGPEGLYRIRMDELGAVPCIGCHNSPHAVWPADNGYGQNRDNIPPLQYMGVAQSMGAGGTCVCHSEPMDYSAHHPNMLP